MKDFDFLLSNPELANNIRIEVTGSDLLSLASTLVKATREATLIDARKGEAYLTIEETCQQVRRDATTLHRWHKSGKLRRNSLGLYRHSDVTKLLNK